ncbi:YbbR-like domain-containing protein [Tellurirhabdus bombi]|uniref:hypothetical protein n=1 Tax=Tellurirhabdus bombi TaxID=2907205 RepID=UPI001F26FD01|nr:hypothetical protein [Tellurirhabdus bombi]
MSLSNSSPRPIHLPTLLLCLLLATLIWLLNTLNKDKYTVNIQYPIQFEYDRNTFIPLSPLPQNITVNVSGNGWILLRKTWLPFQNKPVVYRITDPLRATSINLSQLTASVAEQTKEVHVNTVAGDTLALEFDRRTERIIPVAVDSGAIDLEDHYIITSLINIQPRTVQVDGPARIVGSLPDTLRISIPEQRITNNFDGEVPLNYPDNSLLKVSTNRVKVSFEVAELLQPLPTPSTPK